MAADIDVGDSETKDEDGVRRETNAALTGIPAEPVVVIIEFSLIMTLMETPLNRNLAVS